MYVVAFVVEVVSVPSAKYMVLLTETSDPYLLVKYPLMLLLTLLAEAST